VADDGVHWTAVAGALHLARVGAFPRGPLRRWSARNAHAHAYPEFAVCLRGRFAYGVGGRAVRLRPGAVWLLPRGVSHDRAYGPHHGAGLDLWVHFLPGGRATLNYVAHAPGRGAVPRSIAWPAAVPAAEAEAAGARLAALDAARPDPGPADGLFLLYFVARLGEALAAGAARRPPPERDAFFGRITAYIEANLADDLRLADLAKLAGYSPFHFHRLFARAVGVTPRRFVEQRRLARARTLLERGYRVTDAALEAGFEGPAEFARAFRRVFGRPPSRWPRRRPQD